MRPLKRKCPAEGKQVPFARVCWDTAALDVSQLALFSGPVQVTPVREEEKKELTPSLSSGPSGLMDKALAS